MNDMDGTNDGNQQKPRSLTQMRSHFEWVNRRKGRVLGVLGFIVPTSLALFFGLNSLSDQDAGMAYEIVNEVDVLDVRSSVEDLKITFQRQDIQENNLNLRIYTIRVKNTGAIDILRSHFDQDVPWGVRVTNGKAIEAKIVGGSSDYLRTKVNPRVASEDFVEFSQSIIEERAFLTFDLLVLHTKGEPPDIKPTGKIAGINEIPITRILARDSDSSFFSDLFPGSLWVQLGRFASYVAGAVLLLLVIAFPFMIRQGVVGKRRERRAVRSGALQGMEHEPQRKLLTAVYRAEGIEGLKRLRRNLSNLEEAPREPGVVSGPHVTSIDEGKLVSFGPSHMSARHLERVGAIKRVDHAIEVDGQFLMSLDALLKELGAVPALDQESSGTSGEVSEA
jgi:hypothetical protein